MTEQQRIQDKQWSRIIAKAWADDTFKDRLLSDPKAVLLEHGIETTRDVCVSVAETSEMQSTDEILYLTLPPKPADIFGRRVAPGRSRLLLLGRLSPLRSLRLRLRSLRWLRHLWALRSHLSSRRSVSRPEIPRVAEVSRHSASTTLHLRRLGRNSPGVGDLMLERPRFKPHLARGGRPRRGGIRPLRREPDAVARAAV